MKSRFLLLVLIVILFLPISSYAQQRQAGDLHRVFVIDNSASMGHTNLDMVKKEILAVANRFPPSSKAPISIITFGTVASSPTICEDLDSIEHYVANLKADGGSTNIPGALFRTIEVVKRYPKANVMAFLFSDGKNEIDEDRMPVALKLMNELFNERKKKDLSNIVFLKQWGQRHKFNEELASMKKAGVIELHQSDGVEVVSARITPKFIITDVRRHKDNIEQLVVTAVAKLDVSSSVNEPVTLDFQLSPRKNQSFKPIKVSDNSATPVTLEILLTLDEETNKEVMLEYTISRPKAKKSEKRLFVPQLTTANLRIPVVVPESIFNRLTVIRPSVLPTVPRWTDIETLEAEYDIELEFEVRSIKQDREGPSTFEISCTPPARIVSGPRRIAVDPNTSIKKTYKVRTTSQTSDSLNFGLNLESRVVDIPSNVKFDDPTFRVSLDYLTPPPQIVTTITPQLLGVRKPKWISVASGSIEHQARFRMAAKGPIAPSEEFSVVKTPSLAMKIDSPSITSSETNVAVTIRSTARDAKLDFQYQFLPPKETLAVRYEMDAPVSYHLPAPEQVRLALVTGTRFTVDSKETTLKLPVRVTVPRRFIGASKQVPIQLETDGVTLAYQEIPATLGQPTAIQLYFEPLGNSSFWLDTRKQCSIRASADSTWIAPAKSEFELVAQAPFKKILYVLVIAVCLAIIGLGVWMGLRPAQRKNVVE
ncbi:MAG: vWA domain-containing protein [Planctomycetota bacterium]